ncbi:CaiB/BaiF CoA transferase family protein [Desulforhopalus singaporensis]|uniref:Crotonobetainyl-CoA:carnitine CoA-transferase CaiB n=1 Tax=Desulforhopalus singaporensis TaxID=91360 RepID=A0A1H0UF11_9BACT|nr:CaiB/BaiF CoA-transferase family protein [Desulforhopalus singaporensis]SDP64764.1 Crotonobetainyl-CoA:carnitine CoA-transferase CaiB [Desulforhopalus singaporensis]
MKQALLGIKVLDLTMNLPGPFMTWLMAEMGAEIVKLENPLGGDFARSFNDPEGAGYFPLFDVVNRGKKSITCDLKQPGGKDRVLQMMGKYNIVVEGFRPGVMKKLGLDYDSVSQIHPGVIYVSVSGYGQSGDYAEKGGHDLNYQALAGSFDTGAPITGRALDVPSVPIADLGGGSLLALSGLLAAVIQRDRTGKGCHLDVSLRDGAFAMNVFAFCQMQRNLAEVRQVGHFLSGTQPFYNIYETRDGRHMSLGAVEPKFWTAFCRVAGCEELIPAQFGGAAVKDKVASIFKSRDQAEWRRLFRNVDACCEPVLTMPEVLASDLGRQRHLVCKTVSGGQTPSCPIKTVGSIPTKAADVPRLGAHNVPDS